MKVGNKVEHVLTKDWLLILQVIDQPDGSKKYLCRTKDLREVSFFEFELRLVH
jgi:hypothetical protein